MAKLNIDEAAPRRPLVPVLYDLNRPGGLILEVKHDPRSTKIEQIKRSLAIEAEKTNASLDKMRRLASQQLDESVEQINSFCLGWRRMTPVILQELLAGSSRSITDEKRREMEASLAAAGETEYDFDREVFQSLLEDAPLFRERIGRLANDTSALAEAEEMCRKNGSASGSSGSAPARA